jgi:hypothetical protein
MKTRASSLVPLETVLVAATFDPSCRPFFYKNLLDSEICAGVIGDSHQHGRSPQFAAVDRSGQNFLAVFTDQSMVPKAFTPLKMKFGEFVELSGAQRLSLNPGQAVTKDFSSQELRSIMKGELSSPAKFQKNAPQKISLHSPTVARNSLSPLLMLLRDHPGVKSGWLADAAPATETPGSHLEIGLWLGLDVASDESWNDAAADCTILLSTLDQPPSWFVVKRISSPPPEAELFFTSSIAQKD